MQCHMINCDMQFIVPGLENIASSPIYTWTSIHGIIADLAGLAFGASPISHVFCYKGVVYHQFIQKLLPLGELFPLSSAHKPYLLLPSIDTDP